MKSVEDRKELYDILEVVAEHAKQLQIAAANNGSKDDGGAGHLLSQVRMYRLGLAGELPFEWEQYRLKLDPEYKDYLRLQEKFKHLKSDL